MFQPQMGDVLVTRDRILGMMVGFKRNKAVVSGEYYFSTYPIEKQLDELRESKGLFGMILL